jgi:hypothetical protein
VLLRTVTKFHAVVVGDVHDAPVHVAVQSVEADEYDAAMDRLAHEIGPEALAMTISETNFGRMYLVRTMVDGQERSAQVLMSDRLDIVLSMLLSALGEAGLVDIAGMFETE